jgi:hypothetical protein
MAYAKFDDPAKKVDQSARKVYGATWNDAMRRAIQGITNRVIGGTSGTGFFPENTAAIAKGTVGALFATTVQVVINGVVTKLAAQDNIRMPYGTQGKNTVAKFLICSNGTSGTVIATGPGNVVSKADYATIALATAAAKLPDLPDDHVALGYVTVNAPTLTDIVYAVASVFDTTGGTASYTDLICMPYED